MSRGTRDPYARKRRPRSLQPPPYRLTPTTTPPSLLRDGAPPRCTFGGGSERRRCSGSRRARALTNMGGNQFPTLFVVTRYARVRWRLLHEAIETHLYGLCLLCSALVLRSSALRPNQTNHKRSKLSALLWSVPQSQPQSEWGGVHAMSAPTKATNQQPKRPARVRRCWRKTPSGTAFHTKTSHLLSSLRASGATAYRMVTEYSWNDACIKTT